MSEPSSSTRVAAEHPTLPMPRRARRRPPGSRAASGFGPLRRVLTKAAIATAMVAALLSGTAGVADARVNDNFCKAMQDGHDWALGKLNDAMYAGDISDMRFWLREVDSFEIAMIVGNC